MSSNILKRKASHSPPNSPKKLADTNGNVSEQIMLDAEEETSDALHPEVGKGSPRVSIASSVGGFLSPPRDTAPSQLALDQEVSLDNGVGNRPQSPQTEYSLPSPLSDASGRPSSADYSQTEGPEMLWQRKISILLVMGPKPEKGPHNSWHAHENRLGVEWEDMRCSPQLSADLLSDENCRGFIYPLRLAPGEPPVLATGQKWGQWYAHYMTLLVTRFPDTPFVSVTRCSIESFIDKVCSPSELEKLDRYTCIIARLTDPSSDDLSSNPYLASPTRLTTFVSGMRQLCKKTSVFPDIDEMEYAAQKLRVIECLDSIAQSVTSTPRPKTSVAGGKVSGQIYKREGSHCERHVLLPKQIQSSNYRSVMREGQHPTYRWLQQDFVPYNIEWRVFLVGGEVVKVRVSKRKELDNSWVAETQYSRCPLFELEERLRAQPEDEDEFPDLTAHDEESRIRSDEELIGFAERTLAALVQRETEILGRVPSISMLCRLDISVMRQPTTGKLQYWIVSVARGANVPIHGIDDSFDTLGVIADELVDALRKKPGPSDASFPYFPRREIPPPAVRAPPVAQRVKYILVVPGPPNPFSLNAKVWGNTHTIVNSNSLWVKVDLPRTDVQLLVTHKAIKGFIHEIPLRDLKDGVKPRRGYSGVWIHQLVLLGYYWSHRSSTDVTFMSWTDFIDRVIAGTIKADIIWGGVDLSSAFDTVPGLKEPSVRQRFLDSLNKIPATFGTVDELLHAGRKFDVIGDLDNIARYNMGTPRPETDVLSLDGHDDDIDIRSWIFKREGSHNFAHVQACVTPSQLPAHPNYRWLKQQYVRSLDRHVEWHVFMIKGKVKCVFYVMPMDKVGLREVHGVSRDEYSYRSVWLRTKGWDLATMNTFAHRGKRQLVHRSGGTRASLEQADAEMRLFAEGTLAKLIQVEKRRFEGQTLSIEKFCRMDLGIMKDDSGQLQYFVHGIRRGPFIEMFPSEVEDGVFRYLSNEILKVLRE